MSRPPRINVTIDRLALRGFGAGDRRALIAALEGALRREFADPAIVARLDQSRTLDKLDLGKFEQAATPGQLAAGFARRLARRIG